MRIPSRPSSTEEMLVAVYAGAFLLALCGVVAFYYAWFGNAPPATAVLLRNIGIAFISLAFITVAVRWLVALMLD
jgi:hypothetical protein